MLIYLLFAVGFVFLIKGADYLVEGSTVLAKRFGVSDLIIGLTIVSFGTSAPELIVNVVASFQGSTDIAIGNILGSNIANILLILGVAAAIHPLIVSKSTTWKEIPFSLMAAIVLFLLANDALIDKGPASLLSRIDGLMLITYFALFMLYIIHVAMADRQKEDGFKTHPLWLAFLMTIGGCVGLFLGGKWVVDGAVVIARNFGVSESLIGLTIIAVGTSLPELVTSAVAAYRKNSDIAIGNVVGSNIFNIFWVLGLSATIRPMPFNTAINTDLYVVMAATGFLFLFAFIGKKEQESAGRFPFLSIFTSRKYQLERWQGVLFLVGYASYITYLIMRG
ncbi:calcium/sodium antiporter [Candidatus Peregrinibacteria bacterium]|nr:calcium/sodium antiporter [Candidatus Peregrinibacteria bacterium]